MKKPNEMLINELNKLTTDMDIPQFRRTDVRWLARNAVINNPDHPNLSKVLLICKQLS